MAAIDPKLLALQRLYHWERTAPDAVCLSQPMGGGSVMDMTWAQVGAQVRQMATHLRSQGWDAGSKVAILSKNCSWWLMSDLAIWMAGHVSVPLYPTLAADTVGQILAHSEAKACFVGKLDDWQAMKSGVPADMSCISYPLSPLDAIRSYPGWDSICKANEPMPGEVTRQGDELATLIYTSGTTGMPKGVMHSFGTFAWAIDAGIERTRMDSNDRMLSYLPLAHVVERVLVEHGWLHTGFHVFFAESLDTFAADLQRARPTIFFSVPRLWVKFQQGIHHKLPPAKLNLLLSIPIISGVIRRKVLTGLGLDQCRFAAGGAAPMPVALLAWYRRIGLPINEGYGMTENLAVSHLTLTGTNQEGTVGPQYAASSNVDHADLLQGKLLLMVGELDTNVDPSSTMQVVNALIKAGKNFDLLIYPGEDHNAGRGGKYADYGERKRFDFFVRHLLNQTPPEWSAAASDLATTKDLATKTAK